MPTNLGQRNTVLHARSLYQAGQQIEGPGGNDDSSSKAPGPRAYKISYAVWGLK